MTGAPQAGRHCLSNHWEKIKQSLFVCEPISCAVTSDSDSFFFLSGEVRAQQKRWESHERKNEEEEEEEEEVANFLARKKVFLPLFLSVSVCVSLTL